VLKVATYKNNLTESSHPPLTCS